MDRNVICEVQKQFGVLITTSHKVGYTKDSHTFWNIEKVVGGVE